MKTVTFECAPVRRLSGLVSVPGDKSISHRAIMLGAIAQGVTSIRGFLEGEDALATLEAFRLMGVTIERPRAAEVSVNGVGIDGLMAPRKEIYLGNSGTAMRLMTGLLCGQSFDCVLSGDESLSKRPMTRIAVPLERMGARIKTNDNGTPPIRIQGVEKSLKAIDYCTPMASAQVKSAVLLAGLRAAGRVRVTEPAPTRDHTERMLRGFGYAVEQEGLTVSLCGGGTLQAQDIDVPGDFSSAAFLIVAASLAQQCVLTIEAVGVNPTRTGALDILRLMGADITLSNQRLRGGEPVADIIVKSAQLRGIDVPENLVPLAIDEFPILCVAAACASGPTRVVGAQELRVKESDRIEATANGLRALGVRVETFADGLLIHPSPFRGGRVDSLGDHRIAMAFAVASARAQETITVLNCNNVQTSFPNFVEKMNACGFQMGSTDA